jgi:hypothetical protein
VTTLDFVTLTAGGVALVWAATALHVLARIERANISHQRRINHLEDWATLVSRENVVLVPPRPATGLSGIDVTMGETWRVPEHLLITQKVPT